MVLALAFAMSLGLALPASAVTTTWNFSNGSVDTDLGSAGTVFNSTDTLTNLTAQGFAFNSGGGFAAGDPMNLRQSAEGLGIKGGGTSGCATNDIDQCAPTEFLRLLLPTANWDPISVTLTTSNVDIVNNWEIYGDNDGDFFNGATLLASGGFTTSLQTILLGGITPFQFVYIKPPVEADCTDLNCLAGHNDAFRVAHFVGQVPEPGTLLLLGAGLAGLAGSGFVRRRR